MFFLKTLYLLFIAITGFIVMSSEIIGQKVLSLFYGHSSVALGALIGVVLLVRSLGYFFGGFISNFKKAPLYFLISLCLSNAWCLTLVLNYKVLGKIIIYSSLAVSTILISTIFFFRRAEP